MGRAARASWVDTVKAEALAMDGSRPPQGAASPYPSAVSKAVTVRDCSLKWMPTR